MLKTILITFAASLLFGLLVPAVLGAILATLFSGLTILDPLYAADRAGGAWFALGGGLAVQGLQALVSAPLTAAALVLAARRVRSGWLLALGLLLGGLVHALLLPVYLRAAAGLLPTLDVGPIVVVLWLLALTGGPLLGLVAAWAARRQ